MPVGLCAHNIPGHVSYILIKVGNEESVHLKATLQKKGKQKEKLAEVITASFV